MHLFILLFVYICIIVGDSTTRSVCVCVFGGGGKNNNILSLSILHRIIRVGHRWDLVFNTSAAHMYNQTFTPPHMCACLKPGLGLSSAFFVFSEMRGFCSSLY